MSIKFSQAVAISALSAFAGAAIYHFCIRKAEGEPMFTSTKRFKGIDPSGDMARGFEMNGTLDPDVVADLATEA